LVNALNKSLLVLT